MKQQKSKLKRIKRELERIQKESENRVMIDFVDVQGRSLGETFDISFNTEVKDINSLLQNQLKDKENDFTFYYQNYEFRQNFKELLTEFKSHQLETEGTLKINYVPDSLMGIRPITRISSSLEGHTQSVLDVAFAPNNKYLASCSGDMTIRLWDVLTETPVMKFEGFHKNWVLTLAWSPDSKHIASGDYNGLVAITEVIKTRKYGKEKNSKPSKYYFLFHLKLYMLSILLYKK